MTEHNEGNDSPSHTMAVVVELTHVEREQIIIYCRRGLLQPDGDPEDEATCRFDDECILRLRHIESIRSRYNLTLDGLELVSSLMRDVERLREELRYHLRR